MGRLADQFFLFLDLSTECHADLVRLFIRACMAGNSFVNGGRCGRHYPTDQIADGGADARCQLGAKGSAERLCRPPSSSFDRLANDDATGQASDTRLKKAVDLLLTPREAWVAASTPQEVNVIGGDPAPVRL